MCYQNVGKAYFDHEVYVSVRFFLKRETRFSWQLVTSVSVRTTVHDTTTPVCELGFGRRQVLFGSDPFLVPGCVDQRDESLQGYD